MTARLWRATVRGVEDVIVGKGNELGDKDWHSMDKIELRFWHEREVVSDLVPLVTLTEDDARYLISFATDKSAGLLDGDRTLREIRAQLTPPRMDEPTEFGAMVEAECRPEEPAERWVRVVDGRWYNDRGAFSRWHHLIDPRPIGGES
jgi:hypothetical protein